MQYTRPTLVSLGKASTAIQGFGNKNPFRAPDADIQRHTLSTGSSYDLDE